MSANILLYEDDLTIRELVTSLLEDEGYLVIDAHSIEQGEAIVQCSKVDLFLADTTERTKQQAMEMLEKLCNGLGREIPIVVFTAHRVDRDMVQDAGCADLIHKPFDVDELLGRIAENLRQVA